MRHFIIIIAVLVLFLAATIIPAYAQNKRAENNKNIADFILDTIKLPYLILGTLAKQDSERVKKELGYTEHQGLKKALR